MQVSESKMRAMRGFLAKSIAERTKHLPSDHEFSRGLAVGLEVAYDASLTLFDILFGALPDAH